MTDRDPGLTDENAQKVLARALEVQAQHARTLTVTQIREIAAELSIPESAVDQALSEYRSAAAADLSPHTDATAALTARGGDRFARPVAISLALAGGAAGLLAVFYIIMRLFPAS